MVNTGGKNSWCVYAGCAGAAQSDCTRNDADVLTRVIGDGSGPSGGVKQKIKEKNIEG